MGRLIRAALLLSTDQGNIIMKRLLLASAVIFGATFYYLGAFDSPPSQPKKADAQYGDTIAANVATFGCDTEESHDKARRLLREGDQAAAAKVAGCSAIPMASTGKAIKTYGKFSICVRWQGEPDCLWSPRDALLFIPAESTSK
jgi:hypothetical protein